MSEDKTAFFSNHIKSKLGIIKHGKNCQCGTSFDVAILIKTHWHIFRYQKIENTDKKTVSIL